MPIQVQRPQKNMFLSDFGFYISGFGFFQGPGGFRELREASRNHFHLVPGITSYGQAPSGGISFTEYGTCYILLLAL